MIHAAWAAHTQPSPYRGKNTSRRNSDAPPSCQQPCSVAAAGDAASSRQPAYSAGETRRSRRAAAMRTRRETASRNAAINQQSLLRMNSQDTIGVAYARRQRQVRTWYEQTGGRQRQRCEGARRRTALVPWQAGNGVKQFTRGGASERQKVPGRSEVAPPSARQPV